MKKIYLILFTIPICLTASGQWTQIYYDTLGTGLSIRDIAFVNEDTGWAVGGVESGVTSAKIMKTTDGGDTWTDQNSGLTTALRAIHCFDENNLIACGFSGKIIKSSDGGDTWTAVSSGVSGTLRSMSFPSPDTGYLCGSPGLVLKTVDGGDTWTSLTTSLSGDLINIRFANNDVGYAVQSGVASTFLDGYVTKTTDGGQTWTTVYSNPNIGLLGLGVIDEDTVYVAGMNETILKTTDGGSNWTQLYSSSTVLLPCRGAVVLDDHTLRIIAPEILYTGDAGVTWTSEYYTGTEFLGGSFVNANLGFAGGAGGVIIRYFYCPQLNAISAIDGPTSICNNQKQVYAVAPVEGADTYTWTLPEGSTIIYGEGTDSITVAFGNNSGEVSVTASNSCDTTDVVSISVTVNIPPPVPTITFDSGVLMSSASSGNQWYYNGSIIPGATDQTYTPTANGTYYVEVSSVDGCFSQSDFFEVIGVGIGNLTTELPMTIFPNPMNQSAQINIGATNASRLIISDVQGRLITNVPVTSSQFVLSKNDLNDGMYMVQLISDKNELISRMKLIVQ